MSLPASTAPAPQLAPAQDDEPPVIEVKHLVKEYRLGALEGLRSMARRVLGRGGATQRQQFRALDDVSFSVKRGEVVGIIGHNGAGKSTLLKHLCRITTPTSGSVTVRGRVAPLIEVGAGLVGEMTGRENIYLNASILGLTREEIESKVDEIIAFADLEKFIDTPIKRFSSGMQVRLGFSIATAVEADVLIVDEVLAVGDIAFQQKCLERVEQLIRGRGRTVLIVGHNIRQLQRVCSRLIMLENGSIVSDGPSLSVSEKYFADAQQSKFGASVQSATALQPQESVEFLRVDRVSVAGDLLCSLAPQMSGELFFVVEFSVDRDLVQPEFVLGIHTLDFVHLISISNAADAGRPSFAPGSHRFVAKIRSNPLRSGSFSLRLGIVNHMRQLIWYAENLMPVSIVAGDVAVSHLPESGLLFTPAEWCYSEICD